MAPEQAGGLISEVDARTDVYGLGAILYHLLTYRPPFTGKSNREIVNRVLEEEVSSCSSSGTTEPNSGSARGDLWKGACPKPNEAISNGGRIG